MTPKLKEIFYPMLDFLKDGKIHTKTEVREYLGKYFKLTDEEKKILLPSGGHTVFRSRVSWARTFLLKAGLVSSPEMGKLQITERGLKALEENESKIEISYLRQFPEFEEFYTGKDDGGKYTPPVIATEKSPEEIIGDKIEEINETIKNDLYNKIMNSSPSFFERLVLDLVVKMGYGGSFEEASKVIGGTGDEGVDGVIKEDILGLDNIYLQAKRWNKGTVGSKEIQAFVGALQGKGAKKGIFITTSKFTRDALDYVAKIHDVKVILIDKDQLLDYMLRYNVGVETKYTIEIKKIDDDYFEED
ncbi:MAG: restriction endonuclease [Candidatus Aenigmatarchaeota archaeon]